MVHPQLGVRDVRIKAVNAMRQNGWRVADELSEEEVEFFTAGAGSDEQVAPVRMVHPRLGVRHVRQAAVEPMLRNGWAPAPLEPPRVGERGPELVTLEQDAVQESRADTPPRRRRKTDNSDQEGSD